MRQKFCRQVCQIRRYMFEVSDPYRDHDFPGREAFAAVESHTESVRHSLHADDHLVFQFGHHAILERRTVGAESIETHRNASVGILDPLLRAIIVRSVKRAVRIEDAGGEAVRLEAHALRHVLLPAIHQAAKNTKGYAAASEVRSDRKSVRTCSNDSVFSIA